MIKIAVGTKLEPLYPVGRQRCLFLFRFFSASSDDISKGASFRSINPSLDLLEHLDNLKIGYVKCRRARKVIAVKVNDQKNYKGQVKNPEIITPSSAPPFPFSRGPRFVRLTDEIQIGSEVQFSNGTTEIAVIGRSNVGKSTLINSLLGYTKSYVQKASVSDKPGETTSLKFYSIGRRLDPLDPKPVLVIADMPGFGFAYMSEENQKRCFDLRVLLLLDARHGFKLGDIEFFRSLFQPTSNNNNNEEEDEIRNEFGRRTTNKKQQQHQQQPPLKPTWKLQIVLTKCDLVDRLDLARRVTLLREQLKDPMTFNLPHGIGVSTLPVMVVSGELSQGILGLQKELASLVPPLQRSNTYTPSSESQEERKLRSAKTIVNSTSSSSPIRFNFSLADKTIDISGKTISSSSSSHLHQKTKDHCTTTTAPPAYDGSQTVTRPRSTSSANSSNHIKSSNVTMATTTTTTSTTESMSDSLHRRKDKKYGSKIRNTDNVTDNVNDNEVKIIPPSRDTARKAKRAIRRANIMRSKSFDSATTTTTNIDETSSTEASQQTILNANNVIPETRPGNRFVYRQRKPSRAAASPTGNVRPKSTSTSPSKSNRARSTTL